MPVILDLPGMFLAGSALAMTSRRRIIEKQITGESRHVRGALIFSVFYGLSTAFTSFWREDWMWSYLPRPPLPTMLWYLIFLALLAASAFSGAILTQRALRTGKHRRAWLLLIGSLLLLGGLWSGAIERYVLVGSTTEFQSGQAYPLSEMPDTTFALVVGLIVNGLVLILIGTINRFMDSREA